MNPLEIIKSEIEARFSESVCVMGERPEKATDEQHMTVECGKHCANIRFAPRLGYGVKLNDGDEYVFFNYLTATERIIDGLGAAISSERAAK